MLFILLLLFVVVVVAFVFVGMFFVILVIMIHKFSIALFPAERAQRAYIAVPNILELQFYN